MYFVKNGELTDARKQELKGAWEWLADGERIPVKTLSEILYLRQVERGANRKLQTVEEHNRMHAGIREMIEKQESGIACPKCGAELVWDAEMLMSMPPTRKARCPRCGHAEILTA